MSDTVTGNACVVCGRAITRPARLARGRPTNRCAVCRRLGRGSHSLKWLSACPANESGRHEYRCACGKLHADTAARLFPDPQR